MVGKLAGINMVKRPGLDNRCRDLDGEIRRRNSDTRIGTLRKTYGREFAQGYSSDARLDTLLANSGVRSLSEYLKRK